ncbi:ArsR family transcriptional regulator [Synechococcus sp. RSCCF101]|uniref:ArsR/SmtB family transcription factor n=1 Tax=Synechococcus sp. RSCCF101 TaxID=2511069 RepID=UPI0012475421|nr:metalloregulator ArsR/SmtB family transcription factor [Synechococcus sp. RSCCF101]QEY31178.1 ArsR family transcriptional regulator [Synechococcus sp. RSCCF101]
MSASSPSPVVVLDAELARQRLKALADPVRLSVVQALGGGERCVCDLTADLGLAQSRLSFHLRVLREAGLLSDRQEGRWVYYRLEPAALESLSTWLTSLGRGAPLSPSRCC